MKNTEQLEDLMQILKIVDISYPLNRLRGWAASPDFVKVIYQILLAQNRINLVLECGSGVSTILTGLLLRKYFPEAKLISLDHNIDYMQETKKQIHYHGLEDNVTVVYAPLVKYKIDEKIWLWYDIDRVQSLIDNKIDLLIVDGPPMATQKYARYPAPIILKEFLKDEFSIALDDAYREDEQIVVQMWKKELQTFEYKFFDTEKGAVHLQKRVFQKQPFISICIPTYNRIEYLSEAIESVLNQYYQSYEIVVIDDGSNCDMRSVIDSFGSDKIRFFRNEKNLGRPKTRNRCIEEAKGEYLLWLDDDDRLLPDTLSDYVKIINTYPDVDVVYGKLLELGTNKLFIDPNDYCDNKKELVNNLFFGCVIPNPATMVKKDLYKRIGNYDESFLRAQDYELWTRAAMNGALFKKCDEVVCEYRIHQNNISVSNDGLLDFSYESLIGRKMLSSDNLQDIFYYLDEEFEIYQTISKRLRDYLDFFNAFYYGIDFLENEMVRNQKVLLLLQMGEIEVAQKLCRDSLCKQLIDQVRKLFKKIDKLSKLNEWSLVKELIDKLHKLIGYNYFEFYYSALAFKDSDLNKMKHYAKLALLANPFSKKEYLLYESLSLETSELDMIKARLLSHANDLEEKKEHIMEQYFEN